MEHTLKETNITTDGSNFLASMLNLNKGSNSDCLSKGCSGLQADSGPSNLFFPEASPINYPACFNGINLDIGEPDPPLLRNISLTRNPSLCQLDELDKSRETSIMTQIQREASTTSAIDFQYENQGQKREKIRGVTFRQGKFKIDPELFKDSEKDTKEGKSEGTEENEPEFKLNTSMNSFDLQFSPQLAQLTLLPSLNKKNSKEDQRTQLAPLLTKRAPNKGPDLDDFKLKIQTTTYGDCSVEPLTKVLGKVFLVKDLTTEDIESLSLAQRIVLTSIVNRKYATEIW